MNELRSLYFIFVIELSFFLPNRKLKIKIKIIMKTGYIVFNLVLLENYVLNFLKNTYISKIIFS